MTESPESTPHLTRARALLQGVLVELREARLAHEAEPVVLSARSQQARQLDCDIEELIR